MSSLTHPPDPTDPLRCNQCGAPWPDATAKAELVREHRADALYVVRYLGLQLAEAARAFPDVPKAELVSQMLGWLPDHALVWAAPAEGMAAPIRGFGANSRARFR
jgi:hypothetical protein